MQFTNALGNAQISTVINEALALLNTIKTTAIATSSATARHKRQQQAQVAKNYQKELSIITQQTQKILAEELRQLNLPNNWWKDLALTSLSKSSIPLQKLDVSCLSALSASSRTASPYSQKAATLGYSYIQPIFNSYSHQRLPKCKHDIMFKLYLVKNN
ncbi:uncharacterized protein TRIADDRAFT_60542 [Trichoplax adhaerens]|uniref:Uncharacterized protein n=1 Tax=Trichoplax adhaerens TaxID=10228 RepID=B3S8H4_TRIAD|nr:predicted protein [Trichoplax adhaerens]EDV20953.1 predicted protein [Trichoplax adhaerens]|eukprot:XP_002116597.1 predicted protein [Trichoplax adhaerens]